MFVIIQGCEQTLGLGQSKDIVVVITNKILTGCDT